MIIEITISLTALLTLAIGSMLTSVYYVTNNSNLCKKLESLPPNENVINHSTNLKTKTFTIRTCVETVILSSVMLYCVSSFENVCLSTLFWVSALSGYSCQVCHLKQFLKWYWNYKNDNIVTCFCILFSMAWIGYEYHDYEWLLRNIYGISIIINSLKSKGFPNVKVACVFLTLMLCYDIFWVFLSPYIFGLNVMEKAVATNVPIIASFKVPLGNGYNYLGFGDVIIPGFFLILMKKIDIRRNKTTITNGYYIIGLCGYIFSLVLTFIICIVTKLSQPALLYIVPFTLYSSLIVAYYRNELNLIWKYKVC
jgi:hypothetical protein